MVVGAIAAVGMIISIDFTTANAQQTTAPTVVDARVLEHAGTSRDVLEGDWLSYGRSLSDTRYSPLTQLDTSNVNRLALARTYATPLVWSHTPELHE